MYRCACVCPILRVESLGEGGAEGHLVEKSPVQAGHRDGARLATGLDDLAQDVRAVGGQPHGVLGTGMVHEHGKSTATDSGAASAGQPLRFDLLAQGQCHRRRMGRSTAHRFPAKTARHAARNGW
jgi:hypothetical protein